MRGLSVIQPWATLLAISAKRYETRDERSPVSRTYRGQIAIHASKSFPHGLRDLVNEEPFRTALLPHWSEYDPPLPVGSIIALADITDCQPTSRFALNLASHGSAPDRVFVSQEELAFGDFYPGRYAFHIENVMQLRTPIACCGMLGLWVIPDDVMAQISMQLVDMQYDEAVREEARGDVAHG